MPNRTRPLIDSRPPPSAKCESLRKLIITELERNRNGDRVSYTDIAKKFKIHPNTVGRYVRQSRALEPTVRDVLRCIERVGDPRIYVVQLDMSDAPTREMLDVHRTVRGRKALEDGERQLDENGDEWVSYSDLWIRRDDDCFGDKKALIDMATGRVRDAMPESDLEEILSRVGAGFPDQYILSPPQLSLSGDDLMRALGARYVLESGRKAESAQTGTRIREGGVVWITNGRYWVSEDDLTSAKEVLLQVGLRHMPVPQPKKGGGLVPSTMRVSKQHKIYLSQVLHSTTLSLLNAAEYIRVHVDDTFPVVSETTLYNIARSMGLSKKRSSSFDPKKVGLMSKELEESAFQLELRTEKGTLRGENLLFMDESNFYLNMGDGPVSSWGTKGDPPPEEAMTKGKSQYLSLILTVGLVFDPRGDYGNLHRNLVFADGLKRWKRLKERTDKYADSGMSSVNIGGWSITGDSFDENTDQHAVRRNLDAHLLLFWHIVPPSRKPHLKVLYEFNEPFTSEETAYLNKVRALLKKQYDIDDLRGSFNNPETDKNRKLMENTLFYLGVDSRVLGDDERIQTHETAAPDVLKERFIQVVVHESREGLPRRFVRSTYKGGSPQPELSTTSKFMHYLKSLSAYTEACFGKDVLEDSRVFVDNASTHGRVNVDSMAASFLHEYAKDLDFEGAVFPPSLSPKYNVAEVVFSYIKTLIRNAGLPPSGQHTVASMTDVIETSLMQVTPAMVAAWTLSRGYRFDGAMASNQLPLGLFTQPIRSSTGGVVFGTGKYTTNLRATGEIDAQALRLAYPRTQPQGEREDNSEIVDDELRRVGDLMHTVATLRFEYQDLLLDSSSKRMLTELSSKVSAILETFKQTLPLYSASYKEIGGDPQKRPSLSQLDDSLLVLSEVARHYTKAVKGAKESKQKLCSLGVRGACSDEERSSTASVCARTFPSRYSNLVCMNEKGQIAKSMKVSQEKRQPHKRFGAEMGDLNIILRNTARLVAARGLGLEPKHVMDIRSSLGDPGSRSARELRDKGLRAFADEVVKYAQSGALRPSASPCARVAPAHGEGSLVIVRDWNAWVSIGKDDVSTEKKRNIVSLIEHGYPEYLVEDSECFEVNNKWGDMVIEIKKEKNSASSMVYSHVGMLTTERFRQIALNTMTKEQLESLGAVVLDVNSSQRDPDVTFHLQTQSHLPLWMVEELKDKLYAVAENPESLREVSSETDMYSQVWNYFTEKATSVKLDDVSPSSSDRGSCTINPLSGTPRCFNFRRLRRLMLDMKFPDHIVKAVHFYSDVSKEGQMPLMSADKIRNRTRWENYYAIQSGPERVHRRWPGYPSMSYSDGVRSVRDVRWATGKCTSTTTRSIQSEYKERVNADAMHVLSPYINEIRYVYLHLNKYESTFKPGEKVDSDLYETISKAKSSDRPRGLDTLVRNTPVKEWSTSNVRLWNEFLHTQLDLQMPDEGVLMYPALLFLTVEEYLRYKEQGAPLQDAINLFQAINVVGKTQNKKHRDLAQFQKDLEGSIKGGANKHRDRYGSEWIVFIPDKVSGSAKSLQIEHVIVSASHIVFKAPLRHIESRLRVGMPWEFVRQTQLRTVPTIMENVVRVYEIDELSSMSLESCIVTIDTLAKLYDSQADEYMERGVSSTERDFLNKTKKNIANISERVKRKVTENSVDLANGAQQFVVEFQKSFTNYANSDYTQAVKEFTFWPIKDDMVDYYVIESISENSEPIYDVQYFSEIEDEWIKSLTTICKQRNSQRRSRAARIPAKVTAQAPSTVSSSYITVPEFRASWLIVKSTSRRDPEIFDALRLAHIDVPKQTHKFRLYQRVSTHDGNITATHDEDSPVIFEALSSQGYPLWRILETVPPPHLTSMDGGVKAYCVSEYSSMKSVIKGLSAYGVDDATRDRICVIHHKHLWIPSALLQGDPEDRFPIVKVKRSVYRPMCFIVDGSDETLWGLTIGEMQTLLIKHTFT